MIGVNRQIDLQPAPLEQVVEHHYPEVLSSISACYDRVFSDEDIQKEQSDTAGAFDSAGCAGGQEW